jgi:hypothetical protein
MEKINNEGLKKFQSPLRDVEAIKLILMRPAERVARIVEQ